MKKKVYTEDQVIQIKGLLNGITAAAIQNAKQIVCDIKYFRIRSSGRRSWQSKTERGQRVMAYQPYYTITDWQNLPSQRTALNRTNLINAENGIKEADNRIVQLDANKAELSLVNTLVKSVTLDANTGILTVTLLNGTSTTYDLDIEKVVLNF